MATEIASAYISLVPSFRGGSRAISRSLAGPIGKAGPQAGRSLGRSILSGVTRAAAVGGGLVAALGVGRLARDVAASASGIQNTTATLTGLLGSAQDATDTMSRLRDVARNSPIDYQTYLAAGESLAYMGYAGEDAEGILRNVGAAITAAGGNDEAMGRATKAMLQMVNSGRVYAAQLNQISDAGVPIFSSLAEHFGTNIENVREMVSAGQVGIEDVMSAIQNAEGDTFQSMLDASDKASKTFSNQWAIAKDNITTTLAQELAPVIERMTPLMQAFAERAPALATSAVAGITGAFGILGATIDGMRTQISDFMDSASGQDLKTDTLDRLSSIWDNLKQAWEDAWPAIQQIAGSLAQATAAVGISTWSILLATIDLLSDVLVDVLVPALQWLADFMSEHPALVTGIVAAYTAWRLAQVALNLAMRANPIGLIITAIVALVTALVYAWQNSETFRDVVTSVWETVRSAISAAWNWVKSNVIDRFVAGLTWLWETTVWVKDGVVSAWNLMRDGASAAWTWIKANIIDRFVVALEWLWDKAVAVKDGVVSAWNLIYSGVLAAWGWLRDNVFARVFQYYDWVWEKAVSVKDGVVGAWRTLRDGVHGAWTWLRDNVLSPVLDWFQDVWDKAVEIAGGIAQAFTDVKDSIAGAFETIWDAVKAPINVVIGGINDFIIDPINTVTGVFGIDPIDDIPKLHTGGFVPGQGEKPYMLLGGESVLNPAATQALGKDTIDRLNRGEAMGGPLDWITDYWNARNAMRDQAGEQVAQWLREGAAFALGKVIDAGRVGIRALPGESFAEDWMHGAFGHFKDQIVAWGKSRDDEAEEHGPPKGVGNIPRGTPDLSDPGHRAFPLPRGSYRVGVGINGYPGHTGQDFPAPVGTPVFAPFAGNLSQINLGNRSFGRYSSVMSGALQFIGAHLSSFVGASRQVQAGDTIGRVGSTGNSTGPHLHAEFRRGGVVQNPRSYMRFDSGGYLMPDALGINQTGKPEPVLTSSQWDAVSALAGRGAAMDPDAIGDAVRAGLSGARIAVGSDGRLEVALSEMAERGTRTRERRGMR